MTSAPNRRIPRITVITPNLNQGRFLERAMCSVIDQGYDNLEYMVIDGGSDDESLPLIQHYDDDIAYWRSQRDAGPTDAINHALRRCTGDIVCILSADDILLPGALDAAAAAMSADDESPQWLIGHSQRIGARDEPMGRITVSPAATLEAYLMHDSGHLPLAGAFFRRSLFERFGPFDAKMRFAYGYEMSCRLLAQDVTPTVAAQVVIGHRDHATSLSTRHMLQLGHEHISAAEMYAEALPVKKRYALWKNCDERRRIYALAEAEVKLSEARRFLWQQLLKRPWWLASEHYRQSLLHGIAHPAAESEPLHAAAA